jgi:hypothetical protein
MKAKHKNKYNPNKHNYRIIGIIIAAAVSIMALMLIFLVPWLSKQLSSFPIWNVIAVLSILVTFAGVTWQVVLYRLQFSYKAKVSLAVSVEGMNAIVNCTVTNIGTRQIKPRHVYLIVEEGIMRHDFYEFPFILKHEKNEWDCVMSKICKQGSWGYPRHILSNDFENIYTDMMFLNNLSCNSIIFMDAGEEHIEDVILRLPKPGAYRVILIFTAFDCDCVCTSREFLVEPKDKQ